MSYRRTKAVSFKQLHHIERDVRSLVMALGAPVTMLRSFGFALSLDGGEIPMMVYDRDPTESNCAKHFSNSSGCCRIVARLSRSGGLWRDGVGVERGEIWQEVGLMA
jgi:hypothetical protein